MINAGLFRLTKRKRASSLGHEQHGQRASMDQWPKHWINWTAYAKGQCNTCNYGGTYREGKCQNGCGKPTQRW